MRIRWFHGVGASLLTLAIVSVGCQPTPPIVDTKQTTPDQDSETRSAGVDIDVDSQTGLNIDIDGKKDGGVDIDVGDNGVGVVVDKPDDEITD